MRALGVMGANRRATTTILLILLQIQALMSAKTTVGGVEGLIFTFRCHYPDDYRIKAKFFCLDVDNICSVPIIQTDKHEQWVEKGRYSMYDNTTAAFFIVRVDKLTLEDSGTYCCLVDICGSPDHISIIKLNVSRVTAAVFPKDLTVDKLHLPLYLTAVMCVAAILCVCTFTLCLLMAVKQQRESQRSRETSVYETMMPHVSTEPQLHRSCSYPDCNDLSTLPPLPPDLCSHFTSKNRESAVTLSPSEYEDVDVSENICQYQHLDLEHLEEHVYHCLRGNNSDKKRRESRIKKANNI
ncbi:uncharacterized protein LOC132986797 [Labrus mixtus]|uniref:uncharacterized protein LOC132986797 n=1 Tax=Labrus mixtus TaxID=508554 RepID=UPI0029C0B6BB|nr:uncharacterized protein LOC132986797 [Labrus mixtus]